MKVKVLIEVEADIPAAQEIDSTMHDVLQQKVFIGLTQIEFRNVRFNSTAIRGIYPK